MFGETGRVWLNRLPALLERFAQEWGLTLDPPFALSCNYVVPARLADGTRVVLKAGAPRDELQTEITALRYYDGRGCVRLLEADVEQSLFLLERLEPGTGLDSLFPQEDDQATRIAACVMRQLQRPAPSGAAFPTIAQWGEGFARHRACFDGGTGPLPTRLVEQAETLFRELSHSAAPPVLLHGDLHHGNILAGRGTWLAIDPKGLIGEPAYEAGALLRNPRSDLLTHPDLSQILNRRVAILAEELNCDRHVIRGWGMAQAALSALWSIEDNEEGWQPMVALAETLAESGAGDAK